MTRLLHRALLRLHPPAFRRRFGPEMVCIFEEASAAESPLRLTWDAAVSLVRQWLLRESIWKYPLAVALAALIVLIGVRLPVAARPHRHAHLENASVEFFMVATLASLTAVSLTTIFCVFWFRMANRLRRPALR